MTDRLALASYSPWFDGSMDQLAKHRQDVVDLSARAEAAVLVPEDAGGWPARWRLQIAAMICEANGQPGRAGMYRQAAADAAPLDIEAALDTAATSFAKKVATEPRAVTADDVAALRAAGVSDADVVRLCELVSFVSYQSRAEIGHALLAGTP